MINYDDKVIWVYFKDISDVAGAMTFLKEEGPEHDKIPMIKFPIEIWNKEMTVNFNCLNLLTGDLEHCDDYERVFPVDFDLNLNMNYLNEKDN